jgi:hypothetical protein
MAQRVVALIDILGLRDILKDKSTEKSFTKDFVHLIRAIIKGKYEISIENTGNLDFPFVYLPGKISWVKVTTLSDSIVISSPVNLRLRGGPSSLVRPTTVVFEVAFALQRALLQLGIITRGGVSVGELHHQRDLIIGSALVEAHELESNVAIYPRAVISNELVEKLLISDIPDAPIPFKQRLGSLFTQDADGMYFVDYLGLNSTDIEVDWRKRFLLIEDIIDRKMLLVKNQRHRQKIEWLCSYARKVKPWAEDAFGNHTHLTDGPLQRRFPRDWNDQPNIDP